MNKILKIVGLVLLIGFFYFLNNYGNIDDEKIKNNNEIKKTDSLSTEGFNPLQEEEKKKHFCQQFIDAGKYYKVWSDTKPAINKTHIFCGEINSKGKPTGFHSMPGGIIPPTIKILKTEKENKVGVYNAQIKVYDIKNKEFRNKFSSIFPNNLSQKEVEKAILNAWDNKYFYKNSQFKGKSGLGFEIWGYTYHGKNKINTAYPIYKK